MLAARLFDAFYGDLPADTQGCSWGHWSSRQQLQHFPYAILFGGHQIFRGMERQAIYQLRDARAVAYSCWRSSEFRSQEDRNLSFSEYLRKPIDWKDSPGNRVERKETILEHWISHVQRAGTYYAGHDNVLFVRYEGLVLEEAETMQQIAEHFGLVPCPREFTETESEFGPQPRKVDWLNDWRSAYSGEDLAFADQVLGEEFRALFPDPSESV